MKLSETAIQLIDQECRLRLALALGFTETWVRGLLAKNKENGPLTTIAAIKVIQQETGLTQSEILEKSEKTAA